MKGKGEWFLGKANQRDGVAEGGHQKATTYQISIQSTGGEAIANLCFF